MTRIKFCGLTRPCDIEAANELKPDYIGFVFARKSKRYVDPAAAKELKALLDPEIKVVGVFVDEDLEKLADLLNNRVIDLAQLHGSEDEDYIRRLRQLTDKPIIKAFRMDETCQAGQNVQAGLADQTDSEGRTDQTDTEDRADRLETSQDSIIQEVFQSSADYVLIDSGAGSGQVFNWNRIKDIDRPFFLAGGMNPSNAGRAVTTLNPYALDVSSGIETDGVKDPEKMRMFVENVRTIIEHQS